MSHRFAYAKRLTASDALVISAIDGITCPVPILFRQREQNGRPK
jgi:hypothetical protein